MRISDWSSDVCSSDLFILARAGLLDGYQICVSWFHIGEFKDEFPSLRAESSRMFVIDRDRLTCAGGTSVVHMASHLIEKHCGRAQALKSLRIMIEHQSDRKSTRLNSSH